MEAAANDPAVAKRRGISQAVAQHFVDADKAAGKHFHHPLVDHNGHRNRR